MACCLLKALTNCLLTKHRLMNFGIITDDTCVLCNSSPETTDHLFFSYEFSTYIWSRCKLKLGLLPVIHPLQVEASEFQKTYTHKTKLSALGLVTLSTTVWHQWKERNNRVFQLTMQTKLEVFNKLRLTSWLLLNSAHGRLIVATMVCKSLATRTCLIALSWM